MHIYIVYIYVEIRFIAKQNKNSKTKNDRQHFCLLSFFLYLYKVTKHKKNEKKKNKYKILKFFFTMHDKLFFVYPLSSKSCGLL